MENSNNNNTKVIGALLIGAAVGAAIGILLTSSKGGEIRKMIADKTGDLSQVIKEKFNGLLADVKKEIEDSKEKANELAQLAKRN